MTAVSSAGLLDELFDAWWISLPSLAVAAFFVLRWVRSRWFRATSDRRFHSRLGLMAGCAAALLWFYGFAKPNNLEISEGCLDQGGSWDPDYNYAQRGKDNRLFPLSRSCSPDFDAVPGWLNPAVAVLAVLSMAGGLGVIVADAGKRSGQRAPEDSEPEDDRPTRATEPNGTEGGS